MDKYKEEITISKEEYEKLKGIEKQAEIEKAKPRNIYDKVDVPIKVLDWVIILGVIGIAAAIIIGVLV